MARSNDGALMKSVLPATNLARIVGLLWDNSKGASDCMDTAGPPFFKASCFARLDRAVKAATGKRLCVSIERLVQLGAVWN